MDRDFPSLIRTAIASEEFEKAGLLWDEYARQLRELIQECALPESSLQQAGELVAWARNVILSQRAHLQDHLNLLLCSACVEEAYNLPGQNRLPSSIWG